MNPYKEMSIREFDDRYQTKPAWALADRRKPFGTSLRMGRLNPRLSISIAAAAICPYLLPVWGVRSWASTLRRRPSSKPGQKPWLPGQRLSLKSGTSLPRRTGGRRFNTVLDCCFFHVLDDHSREKYERVLRRIVAPEGRMYMLCFAGQMGIGPRAVLPADIEQT